MAQQAAQPVVVSADEYYDLGNYSRPISTKSKEAQKWFDRGLIWCYAFNHEEAIECFNRTLDHDEKCAMAYWGIAYCLGPNYNQSWKSFDHEDLEKALGDAFEAIEKAKLYSKSASPLEKALIRAMQARYPRKTWTQDCTDGQWNWGYSEEMGKIYMDNTEDLDVLTLYAESLMILTPWALWDMKSGKVAKGALTLETKDMLEYGLSTEAGRKHPGVLHYYIHLMEMSPYPEKALAVSDNLRGLVPDAGHLIHMPSHLDVLCGDYRRCIASNVDALRADSKYFARNGALNFYSLYRAHNCHFLVYAAMFSGQLNVALEGCDHIEKIIPEELLRVESPPMADWFESMLMMRVHVYIRFGMWQRIIDTNFPEDRELYCVNTSMLHYGKGVAYAATGKIKEAEAAQVEFLASLEHLVDTRCLFNNKSSSILAIAEAMLDGEIEYRRGNHTRAFEKLRIAIARDDNLPYDEPWGWMQPTRHALGALLLEQGLVTDAAMVYRADLGMDNTLPRAQRHPNNVWALHGYHECLKRQGKLKEAAALKPQLDVAMAVADVPIKSSCCCRLK